MTRKKLTSTEMIPFSENEMEVVGKRVVFGQELEVFNTPITPAENLWRCLTGDQLWLPSTNDYHYLYPQCVPDNPAKGNVSDAKLSAEELGGKDMFGILWEYEPEIGGSTVRPGNPTLEDAEEWYDKIVFPTKEVIDSWDWEDCKAKSNEQTEKDYFWQPVICTGFFERLISFMDFEEAAVAIIDPDQQDAVKDLFDKLADLYIMLIDKYVEVFPNTLDSVCIHDDWGHQRGRFFAQEVVDEMIVPYMKRVNDHIRSLNLVPEVHSCGKVDDLIPNFIKAGFEMHECQPVMDFDTLVPKYPGYLFHVPPEVPEAGASDEEQRQAARAFVDKVLAWKNPIIIEPYYATSPVTDVYWAEIYRYSRIKYAEVKALAA